MSAYQYLTEDDVVAFYEEAIGKPQLRYPEGLASAVARPQQSAFGVEAYPSISLKAAALMHSLAENQPFIDGNKRIAWICGKLFLQIHGLTLRASDAEARDLFLKHIAKGMTIPDLADWIDRHASVYGSAEPEEGRDATEV